MKLEDFLDNQKHRVQLELEPQGLLLAEVRLRAHTGAARHKHMSLLSVGAVFQRPGSRVCY